MSGGLDLRMWRRRRVRLVRQTEAAECGLAAFAMIANYHGLDIDLGSLRPRLRPSFRGSTLKWLMDVADTMGFATRALRVDLDGLASLHLPAILHWNMNHFVALERISGGKALIHDPEGLSHRISMERLSQHFTGVALELRPTTAFTPSSQRQHLRLGQLWQRMSGLKRALAQTLLLSLLLEAFLLASPYYMQLAIDVALPAADVDLMTTLAIGFALFALINAGTSLLRSFVLLSAGTSMGYGIAVNIARRLFRLPVEWFEKRHVGDILSRFQSILPIRQLITQNAVATLIDGVLAILTLGVMFFYNVQLTILALAAFALIVLVRLISFPLQRAAQEAALVAAGREQSTMIESLRGIVTLRLFNREAPRLSMWQNKLIDSLNANFSLSRVGIWQGSLTTLITTLEGVISVWLAIRAVIAGDFSLGMLFAFASYKTQFLQRTSSLVDQAMAFRMIRLHLERLADIALTEEDRSFVANVHGASELKGRIELRDIHYRYSPHDPPVLNGVSLTVEPGEHVAITGASGGGKSTLAKIILGLIEPDEGEMLVDGLPLASFGHRAYREQVGAVLQSDNLFAGSLRDNVTLFDENPDMKRVVAATRAAALYDEIMTMPMGYETLVGDMGSSLSGGQKQRLLMARALYKLPAMLVLDEATSHLDAGREMEVSAAIAAMGVTRIVIAHRRETIAVADRVLQLSKGVLEPIDPRPGVDDLARERVT